MVEGLTLCKYVVFVMDRSAGLLQPVLTSQTETFRLSVLYEFSRINCIFTLVSCSAIANCFYDLNDTSHSVTHS